MTKPRYRRILLKISGEALAGGGKSGLDFQVLGKVCDAIGACVAQGVEVGVVIGGGNFWRGVKNGEGHLERTRADRMGMLATVMNCLALSDVLEQKGIPARVMTAAEMPTFAEYYTHERATKLLRSGRVVLFAGGTGHPYFSTDTGAVLRAAEISADVILLAKTIDGVYSADPAKDPAAVKYEEIRYAEVLAKRLGVMDLTATSLAMENHIPLYVFALRDPENILRALAGEPIGTLVH